MFPATRPSQLPAGLLAAGYLAGLAVLSLIALLRQSGQPATQSLWAEDGAIFYNQAMSKPFLRTLVTAYNGYDQLVPRLIVQLARPWPVRDAAEVVAVSGAVGLGLLGCFVFHMSRGHISSPVLRALLVLAMVLLPLASVEMLDNLVDLPWWMFFAAFWALLWRPSSGAGRLAAFLLCALSAASEPLVGLLLPLAALRLAAAGKRASQAPAIGLLVGLAWQAGVVLAAGGERSFPHAGLAGVASNVWARVGLGWLTGLRWADEILHFSRPLAEGLGITVFVAVVLTGLWLGPQGARAFTVVAATFSLLLFAVPVWLRGAGPSLGTASSVGYAGRYSAVPILLIVSAVIVLANSQATAAAGRPRAGQATAMAARPGAGQVTAAAALPGAGERPGPGAALTHGAAARLLRPRALAATAICSALLTPQWVAGFSVPNARSKSPPWATEVALAARHCRSSQARSLVRLATAPPGTAVVLRCRQVLAGE